MFFVNVQDPDARDPFTPGDAFAEELTIKRPTDLKIGPDGKVYLIEFGTAWEKNTDSQIVRLDVAP